MLSGGTGLADNSTYKGDALLTDINNLQHKQYHH
jgi:hypothetical protein